MLKRLEIFSKVFSAALARTLTIEKYFKSFFIRYLYLYLFYSSIKIAKIGIVTSEHTVDISTVLVANADSPLY